MSRLPLEHWLVGSMVERILSAGRLPLVIIRPTKKVAAVQGVEESQPSWVGLQEQARRL